MQIILLGAGKPKKGNQPTALKQIGKKIIALDWQIQTFKNVVKKTNITFLGGYEFEKIKKQYPKISYKKIPNWKKNNILDTFLQADFKSSSALVCYSDTIFRKDIYSKIKNIDGEIVFVVDSNWKKRYLSRKKEDIKNAEKINLNEFNHKIKNIAEFTGLILFKNEAVNFLKKHKKEINGKNLVDLIYLFKRKKFNIKFIDIKNNWAEFNSEDDIARFVLGTKSQTLDRLKPLLKKSLIGDQFNFTISEWQKNNKFILTEISKKFRKNKIIVRSSSIEEDGWNISNAGAFKSIKEVDTKNKNSIKNAIISVIESYKKKSLKSNQIFVQKQIKNVLVSGVIFTCDLESGLPNYKINFDRRSTDSITSGKSQSSECIVINKIKSSDIYKNFPFLSKLIKSIREIEKILNYHKLDIEFAIDRLHNIHIFQVRPITIDHSKFDHIKIDNVYSKLDKASLKFNRAQKKQKNIIGSKTIFGNMPDWNPAEIIGTKPKPLSLDLYKSLITNNIWSRQRYQYGYQNLQNIPLLIEFCNQPFIDVRASLNSFIPKDMPNKISQKIYKAYLNILIKNPSLHDKIEFEVALTCWIPNFINESLERLKPYGLDIKEVKVLEKSLKRITKKALTRIKNDTKKINLMNEKRNNIINSNSSDFEKFKRLVDDSKKLGTLPFAHAARGGFVAVALLKSFVKNKILTNKRYDEFMNGVFTVSSELQNIKFNKKNNLKKYNEVFNKFKHLRPGTYEITNEAYWENPTFYFNTGKKIKSNVKNKKFIANKIEERKIKVILKNLESNLTPSELIDFFYEAIESREFIKLEFTKNLSLGLDYLIKFGKKNNLTRKEISYLKLKDINNFQQKIISLSEIKKIIKKRFLDFSLTNIINLPSLIKNKNDFYIYEQNKSIPNYISFKKATGKIISIRNKTIIKNNPTKELKEKIVLIESADPGYDWLFRYDIKGLITKFGGANSHMAIRSAEKNLPAAIGVGENLYNNLSFANIIKIDCKNKIIEIIK